MSSDRSSPPPAPSQESYTKALHTLSLACLVLCPVLIAIPPRKLDLFTATLGTTTVLSASYLHRERYGFGILNRISGTRPQPPVSLAPEGSEERLKQDHLLAYRADASLPTERAREYQRSFKLAQEKGLSEEEIRQRREADRGILEKVWYGTEDKQSWQEQRDKEIQSKFEEGKGIGDVIMDQIWEVINWGDKSDKK